jgi:hypothetical protein
MRFGAKIRMKETQLVYERLEEQEALQSELGRAPKKEEIEQTFLLARVLYKAVLGLHYKRQEQKKTGQLAIF